MGRRFALVIGSTEYTDPGLMRLAAPGKDAADFARVLKDPELCDFDEVKTLLNPLSSDVTEAIDEFFDEKKPDDLLVLYFSGHGVRDELGSLYLAFKNTIRTRLRATAVKSDYIREAMDQSRSKRQVVILDCCNSGAFPQGTKAAVGGPMGMSAAFEGFGRFVLMASDSTQFAWEGDRIIGEAVQNSLFTHFLVQGLEGDADRDGDGIISVDELYDYAFEEISRVTAKQTPTKAAYKVEGDIALRQIRRLEDIRLVPLPADVRDEMEDTRPYVREAAVLKLEKILRGKNLGMARTALLELQRIAADENTTRRVADEIARILAAYQPSELLAQREAGAYPAPAVEELSLPHGVISAVPGPAPETHAVLGGRADPDTRPPVRVAAPAAVPEARPLPGGRPGVENRTPREASGSSRSYWILGVLTAAGLLGLATIAYLVYGGLRQPRGPGGSSVAQPTSAVISMPIVITATLDPAVAATASAISSSGTQSALAYATSAASLTRIAASATAASKSIPTAVPTLAEVTVSKFKDPGGYYFQVNGGPYAGMRYGPLADGYVIVGQNGKFAVYVDQNGGVYAARFGSQNLIKIRDLQKRDFWALRNNERPEFELRLIKDDNGTYTLMVSELSHEVDQAYVPIPRSITQ